jgi:hypothetical protein
VKIKLPPNPQPGSSQRQSCLQNHLCGSDLPALGGLVFYVFCVVRQKIDFPIFGHWFILAQAKHADAGCRIYSRTSTSPCVSPRTHRMEKAAQMRISPMPDVVTVVTRVSILFPRVHSDDVALEAACVSREGRRLSASMRCALLIARCFACHSGGREVN